MPPSSRTSDVLRTSSTDHHHVQHVFHVSRGHATARTTTTRWCLCYHVIGDAISDVPAGHSLRYCDAIGDLSWYASAMYLSELSACDRHAHREDIGFTPLANLLCRFLFRWRAGLLFDSVLYWWPESKCRWLQRRPNGLMHFSIFRTLNTIVHNVQFYWVVIDDYDSIWSDESGNLTSSNCIFSLFTQSDENQ